MADHGLEEVLLRRPLEQRVLHGTAGDLLVDLDGLRVLLALGLHVRDLQEAGVSAGVAVLALVVVGGRLQALGGVVEVFLSLEELPGLLEVLGGDGEVPLDDKHLGGGAEMLGGGLGIVFFEDVGGIYVSGSGFVVVFDSAVAVGGGKIGLGGIFVCKK